MCCWSRGKQHLLPVTELSHHLQWLYHRLGRRTDSSAWSYSLSLYTPSLDHSVNAPTSQYALHYSLYKHQQFYDQCIKQTCQTNLTSQFLFLKASEMKIQPVNKNKSIYSRMKLMRNTNYKPAISLQIKRTPTHKQIVNKTYLSNNCTSLSSCDWKAEIQGTELLQG